MTKLLIILLISSLMAFDNPKDLGSCIRYQVRISLSSDKIIEGIVQHATYQPRFDFSDSEFQNFLESIAYNDTVTVYKRIYKIGHPNPDNNGINCIPDLYAIAPEDIVKIPYEKILEAHLIDYEPCDNCTSDDEQTGFNYNGPSTIMELTKKEIMLLQQKPVAQYYFWYPTTQEELGYGTYQILSYNKEIGLKELKEVGDRLINEDMEDYKQGAYNSYPSRQKRYQELKANLRLKNVILYTKEAAP